MSLYSYPKRKNAQSELGIQHITTKPQEMSIPDNTLTEWSVVFGHSNTFVSSFRSLSKLQGHIHMGVHVTSFCMTLH